MSSHPRYSAPLLGLRRHFSLSDLIWCLLRYPIAESKNNFENARLISSVLGAKLPNNYQCLPKELPKRLTTTTKHLTKNTQGDGLGPGIQAQLTTGRRGEVETKAKLTTEVRRRGPQIVAFCVQCGVHAQHLIRYLTAQCQPSTVRGKVILNNLSGRACIPQMKMQD